MALRPRRAHPSSRRSELQGPGNCVRQTKGQVRTRLQTSQTRATQVAPGSRAAGQVGRVRVSDHYPGAPVPALHSLDVCS